MWKTFLLIAAVIIIAGMVGYAAYLLLALQKQKKALLRLRALTAQAHERLKATLAETRATLDLTNDILYGSGAIWDGLHESLFHLMLPDEVMDEGRSRAQKHYKPRILA